MMNDEPHLCLSLRSVRGSLIKSLTLDQTSQSRRIPTGVGVRYVDQSSGGECSRCSGQRAGRRALLMLSLRYLPAADGHSDGRRPRPAGWIYWTGRAVS